MQIPHTSQILFSFWLFGLLSQASARTGPFPETFSLVPPDSIIVLSIDGKKIISKSGILKNNRWTPLIDRLEEFGSPIRRWLSDSNESGIEWSQPLQFFVRLIEGERPHPQFGAIAKISSTKQADNTLADLAGLLGLRPSKNNPQIYQRTTQPFAIGRQGNFCFLIGSLLLKQGLEPQDQGKEVSAFVSSLSSGLQPNPMPASLARHASQSADISIYIEGTGNGRMLNGLQSNTLIESLFPIFDPLLQDSFGLFLNSQPGNLQITASNYTETKTGNVAKVEPLKMVDHLPGDAPLVARLSMPADNLHGFLGSGADTLLRLFSANKLGADTELPGFDLTPRELLQFPSGDFVLAGGNSQTKRVPLPSGESMVHSTPIWAMGTKISQPLIFRELIAGMNAGLGLNTILNAQQIQINEKENAFWISTPEYSREIRMGNPIEPLSFKRRKLLNHYHFALDFDPVAACSTFRQADSLNFEQLKKISLLDEFKNFSLRLDKDGLLRGNLRFSKADKQGWQILTDRLGQEWIDQINSSVVN